VDLLVAPVVQNHGEWGPVQVPARLAATFPATHPLQNSVVDDAVPAEAATARHTHPPRGVPRQPAVHIIHREPTRTFGTATQSPASPH